MNELVKDYETFNTELKNIIDALSLSEEPKVVGSYSYNIHKYPSDIDIFETVNITLSREEASRYYATRIIDIVYKQQIFKDHIIFNDFKIGTNPNTGEKLHWTVDQIINNNNNDIKIHEAIESGGVIKFDVITWFDNRFQSVELFYELKYNNIPFLK